MGTLKLLVVFSLFIGAFGAKDCKDVACTKDCKRIEHVGQCPFCRCEEDKEKICQLKLDQGEGKSHYARYHYSGGWCKEFSYKGDGGNYNNFDTMEDCQDFCSAEKCPQLNCEHHCEEVHPEHGCPFCKCIDCPKIYCPEKCKTITPEKGCAYCECHDKKCDHLTCGEGCIVVSKPGSCPKCDCSGNQRTCHLKPHKGSGRGHVIRFYHAKGQCRTFIYSGKGGNSNRFMSKEECEKHCGVKSCPSLDCEHGCEPEKPHGNDCPKKCVCEDKYKICQMPVMEGFGRESWQRYYYDSKYGVCERFYFKGKGGNYNNFKNREECENYCSGFQSSSVCSLDKEPGSCHDYEKRFYFDYKDNKCKTFSYGGCYGNGNNFLTKEECDNTCKSNEDVCYLQKDNGPCFGYHKKFYYDPEFDECSIFYYGGCHGNKNRFDSQGECEYKCKKTTSKCDLKPDKGSCNGQHKRYYFSKDDASCKEFYYGGCEGNLNNFKSKYECEHECLKTINKCELDQDAGTCYGNIRRYYYNKKIEQCAPFIFSGCDGNANNFATKDECEIECKDLKDICTLTPDKGPCHERRRRYYYSQLTQSCQEFYYGGCEGNDNNFETKAACQKRCAKVKDVCQLAPDKGPCHGYIQKYYYNKIHRKCEQFIYGGCKGNENNFYDMESCERKCKQSSDVCNLRPDTGPCRAVIKRFYFNQKTGRCEYFIYGGCLGNANNFGSIDECNYSCKKGTVDVCRLDKDKGPCYGNFERYFYNFRTGKCEGFVFGGCEGNANNFKTLKSCENRCGTKMTKVCDLKADKGPCHRNYERFFFNQYSKKCEKFYYGGCEGNANNFQTLEHCRKECGSVQADPHANPCDMKPNRGPCSGHLERYYFNKNAGTCNKFIYGGCEGNSNNFDSLADCLDECKNEVDPCSEKPDRGPCYGHNMRYYYNYDTHLCETFIYGGCLGNKNNFRSMAECRQECQESVDVCKLKYSKGHCQEKLRRYYFNGYTKRCEYFIYSGCGGNKNNFHTLQDCQNQCDSGVSAEDVCELPRVKGPCKSYVSRFYYDNLSDTCKRFTYGGCNGNGNNFASLADCRGACGSSSEGYGTETDVCQMKPVRGPCKGKHIRYYFDPSNSQCRQFTYGGCGGNENNFNSAFECEQSCSSYGVSDMCDQSPDKGPCRGTEVRFYYNSARGDCEKFTYGGCEGNSNNFVSVYECRKECGDAKSNVCDMNPEKGSCRKNIRRYYFNKKSGSCETFVYGGCSGNGNNFETLAQCKKACGSSVQDACDFPADRGPCRARLTRYFYDKKTGGCQKFIFGGCEGNANNFETLYDCEQQCSSSDSDICSLNPDKGACGDAVTKYYFNQNSQKCETFVFTGCGGNPNNFDTKRECEERCGSDEGVCALDADKGPCHLNVDRYFYNRYTDQCEYFNYGGCEGNGNNFVSLDSCLKECKEDSDTCGLPSVHGPCKGNLRRYFFDRFADACKQFFYGGCGGNANNFGTAAECRAECKPSADVCSLKPVKGPCPGRHNRFYFNSKRGYCEKFEYGGCEGNANNFLTLNDCENECKPHEDDVCQRDPDKGPCHKHITRYYHNYNTRKCEEFIYGGCGGNGNNFVSLTLCQRQCETLDVCQQPVDQGPCNSHINRYFYNEQSGRCERFTYGGCEGNGNNFDTIEDCRGRCETENKVCGQYPDRGPCKSKLTRYFFDKDSGQCERFIYGGCEGNGNNFQSIDDCQKECGKRSENVCDLHPEKGSCHKEIERYYFNKNSNTCETFIYGGCGGNANNFETIYSCQKECNVEEDDPCEMEPEKGPCKESLARYYYSNKKGMCESFYYGGCGGNENRFPTKKACEAKCMDQEEEEEECPKLYCAKGCWAMSSGYSKCPVCACQTDCHLPMDEGHGTSKNARFYFDTGSNGCRKFNYKGQGGNKNYFMTEYDCTEKCSAGIPCEECPQILCDKDCRRVDLEGFCPFCSCQQDCMLAMDEGKCNEQLPRFYYNSSNGKCESFYYGGCEGNGNHFYTKAECEKTCHGANQRYRSKNDEL